MKNVYLLIVLFTMIFMSCKKENVDPVVPPNNNVVTPPVDTTSHDTTVVPPPIVVTPCIKHNSDIIGTFKFYKMQTTSYETRNYVYQFTADSLKETFNDPVVTKYSYPVVYNFDTSAVTVQYSKVPSSGADKTYTITKNGNLCEFILYVGTTPTWYLRK